MRQDRTPKWGGSYPPSSPGGRRVDATGFPHQPAPPVGTAREQLTLFAREPEGQNPFPSGPPAVARWTRRDLNPWPRPCEGRDLPADLRALSAATRAGVGVKGGPLDVPFVKRCRARARRPRVGPTPASTTGPDRQRPRSQRAAPALARAPRARVEPDRSLRPGPGERSRWGSSRLDAGGVRTYGRYASR